MIIGKTRTNQPVEGDAKNMATALEGQDLDLGDLTADSIIENMSGYSFEEGELTGYTFSDTYASVVKTGNKITFVISTDVIRDENGVTGNPTLGKFTVPASIYNKLYPSQVGLYNFLDNRVISAFSSYTTEVDLIAWVAKSVDLSLQFVVENATTLTANTKYHIRYECTFLLSDNLAPQE